MERPIVPLKIKLGASILSSLALAGCGGDGDSDSQETPTVVPTPQVDMAARFGEAFGIQNNWVDMTGSESLKGLKEFTVLSRVKIEGIPPDAVVAKGDSVEAWAFFTSFTTCLDRGMALVVDDERYCSGMDVPRDRFVNVGVTLKDGKARFFVDEKDSLDIAVDRDIPTESGRLYIGASPKGADEGFSGQIDDLVILNKAISPDEVREGFKTLSENGTKGHFTNKDGVVGLWVFDGDYKDFSGKENDGSPRGEVSLVEVK